MFRITAQTCQAFTFAEILIMAAINVADKHDDLRPVCDALTQLANSNLAFWYDRGIPGGSEWDEVIEKRIQNSWTVLLFLSDAAIESKWVRREAKFADALAKPLVMVNLGVTRPGHGMALLMNQYQVINAAREDYYAQLIKALSSARKATRAGA